MTGIFITLAQDPQALLMATPFWVAAAWAGWQIGGVKKIRHEEYAIRSDIRYRIIWLFRNTAGWR
jgi:hypothetical protein